MANSFELNLAQFINDLNASSEVIGGGAKRGLQDALDDWKRESTDLAPLSKHGGTLRRSIKPQDIEGSGLDLTAEITANAVEDGFNYAYYIHEVKGEIKNPTTPGTIAKFLEKPAKDNHDKWMRWVEEQIKDELKRKGW